LRGEFLGLAVFFGVVDHLDQVEVGVVGGNIGVVHGVAPFSGVDRLIGLLVCWFVGLLVCWFVGLLVRFLNEFGN
jgi:hypothetical protein